MHYNLNYIIVSGCIKERDSAIKSDINTFFFIHKHCLYNSGWLVLLISTVYIIKGLVDKEKNSRMYEQN